MKKNTGAAVLLCAAALGCATACSGHSSTSAAGAATTSAAPARAAGAATTAPAAQASQTSSNTAAAAPAATPTWSAVPRTWLSPAQVPLDADLHWTGGAASTAQSGVALLGETPVLYPCMSRGFADFTSSSIGYAANYFIVAANASNTRFNTPRATQEYNVYRSAAAARTAFQSIKQDVSHCSGHDLQDAFGVPSTQTATVTGDTANSFAFTNILRTDQGKPAQTEGNYGSASDYHTYVVLSGNLIEVVYLEGGPAVDPSGNDSAALATLVNTLS